MRIGDTTNLAARLEQAAHPGQILMSEPTARLVRGYVEAGPLPPLIVKGKREVVTVYEVKASGQRRSRLEESSSPSPFSMTCRVSVRVESSESRSCAAISMLLS